MYQEADFSAMAVVFVQDLQCLQDLQERGEGVGGGWK